MAAVYPAGASRVSGETLALSTTLASLGCPPNAYQAIFYDPSVDFRLHLNPAILAVYFYDASNSAGARFEKDTGSGVSLKSDVTDRASTGTGTAMDSATTSDFLYICTADIVSGFRVTLGSVSDQVADIAATYWDGSAWTGLTETDGTQTGGNTTLGQTGSITWTAPTDAVRMAPRSSGNITDADAPLEEGFWWRLAWTGALGSNTEITELWTLNKDTSRGYFRAGVDYHFSIDRRNVGAFEAALAAGTDTLQVTWTIVGGV